MLGPRALATEPQPEALAWLPEAAWLAVQRLAQSMATLRDLPRRRLSYCSCISARPGYRFTSAHPLSLLL